MLNASGGLAGPKTSETKHRLRNSRRAQFDCLFRKCDAEPIGAFAHQPSRTGNGAMAVSIRLHHSHHARHRTDALLDPFEVCGKVIEIDISPGRTPRENVFLIVKRRHDSSLQRNVLHCPQPRLKGESILIYD